MYNLSDIGVLKKLLFDAGFSFKKSLGQNFLINPSVCPDMAEACGCQDIGAIEIGTGIGVLSCELAKRAKKVICIEIDKRLEPILNETLKDFNNIEIVWEDVMNIDLNSLIKEKFGDMPVVICANLPYYITSPIIMMLLESRLPINSITVMVQKEAADRLTAEVGTRESGAVTVAVNYYAEAKVVRRVSRGSFIPQPNVDSTVIKLDIRPEPPIKVSDEKKFFRLIRAAFQQRRKTFVNSVSSVMHIEKSKIIEALEKSGLSPTVRGEGLTMSDFEAVFSNLF